MPHIDRIARHRNGKLPKYAWPGGYVIQYYTEDGLVVCADCANREVDEAQKVIGFDIQEGDPEIEDHVKDCEDCGEPMDPTERSK